MDIFASDLCIMLSVLVNVSNKLCQKFIKLIYMSADRQTVTQVCIYLDVVP